MRQLLRNWKTGMCICMLAACGANEDAPGGNMPGAAANTLPVAWPAELIEQDVALSWQKARVYVPHATTPVTLDQIPAGRQFPVALFMHGCWGFDTEEHAGWASLLASQGFLVVLPDSLARPHRIARSCDRIDNYSNPAYLPVHDMRLAEIAYANAQIRKQPWFDGKNLFLMGYSEGAIAVVRTPLSGFSGAIALSWTCTHTAYAPLHGIHLPRATPLLTIAVRGDPWFPGQALQGECGQHMAGRSDARHMALPGQNQLVRLMRRAGRKLFGLHIDHRENHSTFDDELARREVIRFLRRHRDDS